VTSSSKTASPARETALDLARLSDALHIDAKGFFAFVVYESASMREALMREVEKRLQGEVRIRRVKLTEAHPRLPELVGGNPKSQGLRAKGSRRVAYFAYGFETVTEAQAKRQMYGALQIKREALARLGVPVVLWLKPEALSELATRAADFFAQRGGLYDFRAPASRPKQRQPHTLSSHKPHPQPSSAR
jgi:hypothetical protein